MSVHLTTNPTLIDIARTEKLDLAQTAAQFAIARSGSVFNFLPFRTKDVWEWTEQFTLEDASSQYRALNEEPTRGSGTQKEMQFGMSIMADRYQLERLLARRPEGQKNKAVELQIKAAGFGFLYNRDFIKGSSLDNPREFDGLQSLFSSHLVADQTMDTGNIAGAALSLETLNEAMDRVRGGTSIIVMSKSMKRKFQRASETAGVGGEFIQQDKDQFGRPQPTYNGIPLVTIEDVRNADTILGYDEVSTFAGAANSDSTSIYLLNLGEQGFYGAQQFDPMIINHGLVAGTINVDSTDLEWTCSLGVGHDQVGVRIGGISDLAIIA